jgi:hypothetical protein
VRSIIVAVCSIAVLGCASLPPTIDQGEYQNYQYGFIVRLPEKGWNLTKSIPELFAAEFDPKAADRVLLLLYNSQAKGMIAIRAGTLVLSYENILTLQERLTEFVEPILNVDWFLITKDDAEIRGSYQIYQCDASGLHWQERTGYRELAGIRHTSQGYIYPLKGETCGVTFYLFSDPETFDENVKALHQLVRSFSSGEVFTTKVYGWR